MYLYVSKCKIVSAKLYQYQFLVSGIG